MSSRSLSSSSLAFRASSCDQQTTGDVGTPSSFWVGVLFSNVSLVGCVMFLGCVMFFGMCFLGGRLWGGFRRKKGNPEFSKGPRPGHFRIGAQAFFANNFDWPLELASRNLFGGTEPKSAFQNLKRRFRPQGLVHPTFLRFSRHNADAATGERG